MPVEIPTDTPSVSIPVKAEIGKKALGVSAKKLSTEFDPTDNDVDYIFELTKEAIKSGVNVKEVDIMAMQPYFEKAKKEAVRKHRNQKIAEYFTGERKKFSKNLISLEGLTDFERRVLGVVSRIPYGEVRTYSEVAGMIRLPRAARAVGGALGRNPFPIVIPCHRVVSKGGLGGFSAGARWKRRLLTSEGAL